MAAAVSKRRLMADFSGGEAAERGNVWRVERNNYRRDLAVRLAVIEIIARRHRVIDMLVSIAKNK